MLYLLCFEEFKIIMFFGVVIKHLLAQSKLNLATQLSLVSPHLVKFCIDVFLDRNLGGIEQSESTLQVP